MKLRNVPVDLSVSYWDNWSKNLISWPSQLEDEQEVLVVTLPRKNQYTLNTQLQSAFVVVLEEARAHNFLEIDCCFQLH